MLVNTFDDASMGFIVEKKDNNTNEIVEEYDPAIMWNLQVKR